MRASGHVSIRKRKRADQWYATYRINGQRFKRRLGPVWRERGRPPAGYYTKRKAEEVLQAVLTDARRGELALPDPTGASSHTYQEACDEWLRYVQNEKDSAPSTVADYRRAVNHRLIPAFGSDTPVASITTQRVDEVREELLGTRLSRRSVQKVLVLNYGILKRAKRKGWIVANPAEDAERVTLKRSGDFNVLTPEEALAVARVADDDQDTALFTVAAFAGLRLGELRALRWRDADFAKRSLHVRRNRPAHSDERTPKSGKVRSVPLIDQAAAALEGLSRRSHLISPDDLVFVSDVGSYLDDGDLRRRFYSALKRAGLGHKREDQPPFRFHDLRHTFGTLAVQVWPLHDVQAYMGHANIQTTMIYAHHVPKHDAADALTKLVASSSLPMPNSATDYDREPR